MNAKRWLGVAVALVVALLLILLITQRSSAVPSIRQQSDSSVSGRNVTQSPKAKLASISAYCNATGAELMTTENLSSQITCI